MVTTFAVDRKTPIRLCSGVVIKASRLTVPLLAALLPLSACGGSDGSSSGGGSQTAPSAAASSQAEPVKVVASTDVYGSVVSAIGGDAVQVTSFIDSPSKDPHDYESTPADAAAVAESGLAVGNGGGYDDFFFKLTKTAGGDRTVIDVAKLSGLEDKVPAGGEFNEHMWFSLPTIHTLADEVASDLSTLRPDQSDTFAANAKTFNEGVDGLQRKIAAIAAAHPKQKVAATEPLPLYLLAAADLVNVTPEEFMAASEEGTDPPAAVVQETVQLVAGAEPVGALLLNTQTENAASDRLTAAAKKAGVPEVAVSETLSEGTTDYVSWLGGQIDALAMALDKP